MHETDDEVVTSYPLEGGWWSPEARRLHLALVIGLPGCFAAGWFEFSRALAGHEIAWVYAGEWPLYGVIGTYMWWKLLHSDTAKIPSLRFRRSKRQVEPQDVADPQLAAWESYLTRLHELDPPGGPPVRRCRQCGSSASTATATNSRLR
jgi:hypothetical protein